jgi:hypothetical protein
MFAYPHILGDVRSEDKNRSVPVSRKLHLKYGGKIAKVLGAKRALRLGYGDDCTPYGREARTELIMLMKVLEPDPVPALKPRPTYGARLGYRGTGLPVREYSSYCQRYPPHAVSLAGVVQLRGALVCAQEARGHLEV